LDVSIQAQVLNLFMDLQDQFHTAYVFISHNLSVVRHVADDVMVMYLGRAVEHGPKEAIFENPATPTPKHCLAAAPSVNGHQTDLNLKGELPSPLNKRFSRPAAAPCTNAARTPQQHRVNLIMDTTCAQQEPALRPWQGRLVACLRLEEIAA
jgi:dipeptide transport system ATP-binding protein